MALPASDSFDASPDALLNGVYQRFLGSTADAAYASGGTGSGLSVWTKLGRGYSGHFTPGTADGPVPGTGKGPFVNTIGTSLGTNTGSLQPTGWALRDYFASEVELGLSFSLRHSSGPTFSTPSIFRIGLAARLAGGAQTDAGTATAHLLGGNGYYFFLWSPGGVGRGVKYYLVRVNSGTVTRLADSPVGAPLSAGAELDYATWYESNSIKGLRFTVHTNGSQVELRGYARGLAGESLVLSYNDTSGSRITAAGRSGFFSSNEVSDAVSSAVAVRIYWFRISTYAGALVAHDDWRRLRLQACAAVEPSFSGGPYAGFSTSGFDLTSGWYGDLRSAAGYSGRIGTLFDRLQFDSEFADKTGFYLSQRPASDAISQDRTLDFEFQAAAPGVTGLIRGAGIVLRASYLVPGDSPLACYYVVVEYVQDISTARVYLRRISYDGEQTLAQKTSGVGVVRGTNYTLRLSVSTDAIPDPIAGPTRLRAYINGTQIQLLAPASPLAGIVVLADGTVIDQSSARVQNGLGEGFYVRSMLGARCEVYIDAWALGVGGGTVEVPEESMPSVSIPGEADDAFGDFPVPYDLQIGAAVEESSTRLAIAHDLDLDDRYRAARQSRARAQWPIGAAAATQDERDALLAFWDSHRGATYPFNFTDPKGRTVVARFLGDALSIERLAPGVYRWSARLEEVFVAS